MKMLNIKYFVKLKHIRSKINHHFNKLQRTEKTSYLFKATSEVVYHAKYNIVTK